MQGNVLYEERITAWWAIGTFGLLSLGFLFLGVFQALQGPLGVNPVPTWLFFLLCAVFFFLGFNFRTLLVRITEAQIRVGYGLVRRVIPVRDVSGCYTSKAHSLRYGGWGVRLFRSQKGFKLVYSVGGTPLVVLTLKSGRIHEFLFSTMCQQRVVETVNGLLSP
ncbi:MAG: hypothetical protein JXQ30_15020 [Spirochaetes bacterium]|nr:hypothetical protein [Spirochaetota bacterium]